MSVILILFVALTAHQSAATPSGDGSVTQTRNGAFIFKEYPSRALAAGEQGNVEFRATYNRHGYVLSCEVTKSSGFRRLDDETCELIVRHARFKPKLLNDGKARRGTQNGIVEWRIPGQSAATAQVASTDGQLPEKLICKRVPRGGSLVIHTKQCLTKREWEFQADEAKDIIGEAQRRASQRIN